MSEHKQFDVARVNHGFKVLQKEGIIIPDTEIDHGVKVAAAEQVVLSIHATAEGAEAPSDKERKTRVKKALGFRSYLAPYYEGASVDELRKIMGECGWSTGQNVDSLATKGLTFYAKMARLPREEGYELSSDAVLNSEVFHIAPAVEIDHGPLADLDDTVRMLGLEHRMSPKYAQGLLIAYGKASSTFDSQVVANTVALANEDVLRRHKFHFGNADTVVKRFSEAYLYALNESLEAPNFERLTKFGWQMAAKDLLDDDGDMQLEFESTVARQLATMYPVPTTRSR